MRFKHAQPSFDKILTTQNTTKMKGKKICEPQQRGENLTFFFFVFNLKKNSLKGKKNVKGNLSPTGF